MSKQLELFDTVVDNVRKKLLDRSQVGVIKYGTTLNQNDHDNYLNHLQQELMDGCNYIEKLLMQKQDIVQLIKQYGNDQELGEQIRLKYGI